MIGQTIGEAIAGGISARAGDRRAATEVLEDAATTRGYEGEQRDSWIADQRAALTRAVRNARRGGDPEAEALLGAVADVYGAKGYTQLADSSGEAGVPGVITIGSIRLGGFDPAIAEAVNEANHLARSASGLRIADQVSIALGGVLEAVTARAEDYLSRNPAVNIGLRVLGFAASRLNPASLALGFASGYAADAIADAVTPMAVDQFLRAGYSDQAAIWGASGLTSVAMFMFLAGNGPGRVIDGMRGVANMARRLVSGRRPERPSLPPPSGARGAAAAALGVAEESAEAQSVWHATTSPAAAQSILEDGINPARLSADSRFGRAFYVAENPSVALAELQHHGANPVNGIRFEIDSSAMRVLDLTDPHVANAWGYRGGPITAQTQAIGARAAESGYNAIRFTSQRSAGVNLAILQDYNTVLRPVMVTPIRP